jgi:hypothetical protein
MLRFIAHDPTLTSADPDSELSLRMRLAVGGALANSSPVVLLDSWEVADGKPFDMAHALKAGLIDPIARYDNYLRWHREGKLFPTFVSLGAWQCRYFFACFQSDADLEWAEGHCKELARLRDEASRVKPLSIALPGGTIAPNKPDVKYTSERNGRSVHDGKLAFYGKPGHVTLKTYHEMGGVCGALSFFASGVANAFGLPARIVGQPGHCAMVAQRSPGRWYLGNDISGWCRRSDRTPWPAPHGALNGSVFAPCAAGANRTTLRVTWCGTFQCTSKRR